MMSPKVSVIIPIYGVEKYIKRCARSLFEQTLESIEYIFIDDCSPDHSIVILNDTLKKYPNRKSQVKIIRMPKNCGLAAVRKTGIQLAKGEYVAHCDSDDWVEIDAYEKLYNIAYDNDLDIVFCDHFNTDGSHHISISNKIDISSKDAIINSISKNASWSIWGALVKRSIYSFNEICYPQNNNGEDFALMFQLIYYAHQISKIEEPLYYYYINPHSITNKPTEQAYLKRFYQLIQNTELVIDFINRHNKTDKFKSHILCYKLYCRTKISALTKQNKYYKLWKSTYPEINTFSILTNNQVPIRTRLHYIAVRLRIYHLLPW